MELAGRDSSRPAIGWAEVGEEGLGRKAGSLSAEDFAKDPGFSASGWPGPAANPAEGYGSPWGSMSALSPPHCPHLLVCHLWTPGSTCLCRSQPLEGFPPVSALSPMSRAAPPRAKRVIMCE